MSGVVRDGRPPAAVVRILNPVARALLRSPAGRLLRSLALLELTGRRSGRSLSIPVGFHTLDGRPVVFTPAPWRGNFAGGHPAVVLHRGRRRRTVGTLVRDPSQVAVALDAVIRGGTSPRALGLRVPVGRSVTAEDVTGQGRAMVLFGSAPDEEPG